MAEKTPLTFDRSFSAEPGQVIDIMWGDLPVRRVTANNPGPMTFAGTNSYLVGSDQLVVIDPGPDDDIHLAALLSAINDVPVEAICITHTHRDHSPLARKLSAMTGAPIVGADRHQLARPFQTGDAPVDQAADEEHTPDRVLGHGDTLDLEGFQLEAIATPGHTVNYLCFAIAGQNTLFSGDHVMGWATSLIAPPDGAMTPYLESLQLLLDRPETLYFPGHGTWLSDAKPYIAALYQHRIGREASILDALDQGPGDIQHLVSQLYEGLQSALHRAAGLVLAHLERLEDLGQVKRLEGSDDLWCRM